MKKHRLPAAVLALAALGFTLGTCEFVIVGILPDIAAGLNVSLAAVGRLVSVFAACYAVGTPLLTALTGRMDRFRLLMGLMLLFLGVNVLSMLAPGVTVLYASRVVAALVSGTLTAVAMLYAKEVSSPEQTARAISAVYAGFSVAAVAGVPIGTAVCHALGWRATFGVILAMGLVLLPVLLWTAMRRRRQMSDASRAAKQKTGTINAAIESGLSGVRTTKAFANEAEQQQRFDEANEVFKTAKRGFHKEMGRFNAVMEFFTGILPVVVIAVGGWLIMRERMDYVDLITFSLYVTAFVSPIRKLANFAEMFSNGFAGLHRFVELMRTEPTIQDAPDAVELTDVRGDVDVEDVTFAYGDKTDVLHHVTLHIPAGETVALVGPSGGGKSTLCQLLPRFYDVDSGSISIDGHDVRKLTQGSLRRSIGIVQQDVFLFADTIRENIRYGRPGASDEEVERAARQAEIYDDIMAMPDGFDTYVGERGALLSGGQKQRVSIARIFLKNPPILILDEATSALDSVTESKIQGAFDRLARGRTTLIIAHRLSTIRSASRILVIRDGRIAEEGSHQALLALNGEYARLYHTQNLGENHG